MREALELWERGLEALRAAEALAGVSSDATASRAYYAAFYAVSALFAAEGKTYRKHSAVEAAVHRQLVKPGRWSTELGASYTKLVELRLTGDYGGGLHVSDEDARHALKTAKAVLHAVQQARPELFGLAES
jgi:uncharacterized protein (UPF0332 family)